MPNDYVNRMRAHKAKIVEGLTEVLTPIYGNSLTIVQDESSNALFVSLGDRRLQTPNSLWLSKEELASFVKNGLGS